MASSKTITNVLLVIVMATAASAATYTVGDSSGWIIPPTPNFYDTWVASKTFRVNDKLVFNFPTGAHTAVRVSEKEYKACTFANPIETYNTGPATVTLKETGAHYYLCSIPGHCSGGQKVSINVVSAASSPPPSKAPSAPSPSPVARPPTRVANPPASSSPPPMAPSAPSPSPLAKPPASIATPPASFSIPPTKSLPPSFPPSSLASPPPPPGSPSPSAGTPPSTPAAGAPGTSSTPPSQPTASAASFSRGFKWTTVLALVLAFTFVW
ncbi:blue copper protein-like [Nymphaea colorata]|nr:blue copper protein-like [Nymphaea colorata]